jgi:hypothetical protein
VSIAGAALDHDATIALIAAMSTLIPAVIASAIVPWLTTRSRRIDRYDEWKRQDDLARRADERERLNTEQNQQIIRQQQSAVQVARQAAAAQQSTARATTESLENIHALVNSDKTTALGRERDGLITQLALLQEIVELRGGVPTPQTKIALEATQARLAELNNELNRRDGDS